MQWSGQRTGGGSTSTAPLCKKRFWRPILARTSPFGVLGCVSQTSDARNAVTEAMNIDEIDVAKVFRSYNQYDPCFCTGSEAGCWSLTCLTLRRKKILIWRFLED
jgi:hypothetical protein